MFLLTLLLTILLVVDCLFLILLVLVQLPKKEAGAGLAFGGAATDALFGAGSGNALTKITKYAAIAFFVLLMLIAVIQSARRSGGSSFERAIEQQNKQAPAAAPASSPASAPAGSDSNSAIQLTLPPGVAAPTPATDATNAAPK
jgi:preprotein translocase subunit SecG